MSFAWSPDVYITFYIINHLCYTQGETKGSINTIHDITAHFNTYVMLPTYTNCN